MRTCILCVLPISLAFAADPPSLHVPLGVRPLKYAAELTLLPDSHTFNGKIDIDVQIESPIRLLLLNALKIDVKNAFINVKNRGNSLTVQVANDQFISLTASSPIPAGPASLHLEYSGQISSKSSEGISLHFCNANVDILKGHHEAR